jgi:GH18 family chitinase
LIALGGWNDSAFSTQYSELVADPVKMANFVAKALAFVRQVKKSIELFLIVFLQVEP